MVKNKRDDNENTTKFVRKKNSFKNISPFLRGITIEEENTSQSIHEVPKFHKELM